jgi:hypothetical protein
MRRSGSAPVKKPPTALYVMAVIPDEQRNIGSNVDTFATPRRAALLTEHGV